MGTDSSRRWLSCMERKQELMDYHGERSAWLSRRVGLLERKQKQSLSTSFTLHQVILDVTMQYSLGNKEMGFWGNGNWKQHPEGLCDLHGRCLTSHPKYINIGNQYSAEELMWSVDNWCGRCLLPSSKVHRCTVFCFCHTVHLAACDLHLHKEI